jgi:AcrR family transcriptional regulator
MRVSGPVRARRPLESPAVSRSQVTEIQRSRLLVAALHAVEELGYDDATVARITGRARVSRRTFYELFANREECIAAVLQDATARMQRDLDAADLLGLAWRERMRRGLWAILCFLDREPELARVLVVDVQRGSGPVLAAREAIARRLVALVDEGRGEKAGVASSQLTAEGVLGATLAIICQDLTRESARGARRRGSLKRLYPELLGIVLLPYLGSAATRREQARSMPAPALASDLDLGPASLAGMDPLAGLQMRLTYRTTRVLAGVGEHPGASNRQVADCAGIADQGQVSKLLARLQRLGLLANRAEGRLKGEPNAWQLTTKGQIVARNICAHTPDRRRAA